MFCFSLDDDILSKEACFQEKKNAPEGANVSFKAIFIGFYKPTVRIEATMKIAELSVPI